jgi:PAS domain S-box-containing protein
VLESRSKAGRKAKSKSRDGASSGKKMGTTSSSGRREDSANPAAKKNAGDTTGDNLEPQTVLRRNQELQAMVRIASTILRYTELDDILAAITEELANIIPFQRTSVALLSPDGQSLVLSHIHTSTGLINDATEGRRIPMDESTVIGWAAINKKPVRRGNVNSDDQFREVVVEAQLQSDMVVPLVARDKLVGTLNVGSRKKDAFAEEDLENLVNCANFVCGAIEYSLLLNEAKEMSERYRTLQKYASDIFMLVDKNTGQLVEVNRKCCEALGYDEDELKKKSYFDLFPHEGRYQARRDFINVLSQKSKLFVDRRMIRCDREIMFVDINASLITIKADTFIHMMVHDISQRKMLEQQIIMQNKNLQDVNRKLREVDRMKTEFLANISHELRTPLSIIIAYSESLRDKNITPEDRLQFLDIIAENGQNLLQLIDDLLDLSHLEMSGTMLNFSLTHIHDVVYSQWSRVKKLADEKQIALSFEPDDGIPVIYLDNRRILQVLMCLLHNAIKFTDAGGSVTLRTSRNDEGVLVEVQDTGKGIAADQIPDIFDTFRQLDGSSTRQWGGLGIGLAMAQHIIELHGGRVWVESEEGNGSLFSVILPVETEDQFLQRENRDGRPKVQMKSRHD